MAINKIPKNYYSDTNIRRDKINEIIDEVNDIASIPSPSEADAGKVVKVSAEGSYELAQDAGAKELIITLANNFTADKTYTEILAALNSGDIVKLVDWTGRNYIYSGMTSGRICFAYLNGYSSTKESDVFTVAVDDTNSWEMFLDTITHLPDVSSADAGKVLTVNNNGAWGAERTSGGLPAVSSADNNKFLTVVSGAWNKSSSVASDSVLVTSNNGSLTSIKTLYGLSLEIDSVNGDITYRLNNVTIRFSNLRSKIQKGMPLRILGTSDLCGFISYYDASSSSSTQEFYGYVAGIDSADWKFKIKKVHWTGENDGTLTITDVFTET